MSTYKAPWTWDGSFPIRILSADGYVVCGDIAPSGEANARLIEAAPDLLIVAKEAIHHDEGGPHSFDRIERARAAIARAEGK